MHCESLSRNIPGRHYHLARIMNKRRNTGKVENHLPKNR